MVERDECAVAPPRSVIQIACSMQYSHMLLDIFSLENKRCAMQLGVQFEKP